MRTFERTDVVTFLHHFQYAAESPIFIANGYIYNVYEQSWFVNPEFGLILLAITEFFDYFLNYVYAFAWMTVGDLSPDDILRPWEYPMVCVGIEFYEFVFVDV